RLSAARAAEGDPAAGAATRAQPPAAVLRALHGGAPEAGAARHRCGRRARGGGGRRLMHTAEAAPGVLGRPASSAPEATGVRGLAILAGALLLLSLPAILLRDAVPAAAALHHLSGPDAPWIPAPAAGLVLVTAPLAALGAIVLLMAPGLLLALGCNRAESVERWVLHGFAF